MRHAGIPDDGNTKPYEVWEENELAVTMFLRISTQWRTSFGGVVGLDYTVLFEMMRLYDITDHKGLFESIQIMEGAALPIMNKKG